MKENCQDREAYLRQLSGLELLTYLYQHKRVSNPGLFRKIFPRKKGLGAKLKPLYDLFQPKKTPMKSPPNDLKLNELDIRDRAPLIFSDKEIAVYTVLFGPFDNILDPLVSPDNIRYYIITDQELREDSLWQKIDVSGMMPKEILGDPVLCNRWCKMHPDLLFPDHEYSVYLDANMLITSDLTPLIAGLEHYPVNTFRHRTRDCAYREIRACQDQKKARKDLLEQDRIRLEKHGLPEHWGLLEVPVIARRHNDPLCRRIMGEWWKNFYEGSSHRDQIALMDCLWQMQIPAEKIGILGSNVRATNMFIQLSHGAAEKIRQ